MKKGMYFIQEGNVIPLNLFYKFEDAFEREDYYLAKNLFKSSFTGIIVKGNEILISFPKHFLKFKSIDGLYFDHPLRKYYTQLLLKVIIKSATKKSDRSIGIAKDAFSSFPFKSFYEIYQYYKNFGLYKETINKLKYGYTGKINWKKTIEKSPTVLNKKSVIYLPMVIQEEAEKDVFITKCMAYAIDTTAELLKDIIKFKKTELDTSDVNFSNNDLILKKLHFYSREVFKDHEKRLLKNLITFFNNIDGGNGQIFIKVNTFSLIWQEMIESYLNNYFVVIDAKEQSLMFSKKKLRFPTGFKSKTFIPDASFEDVYSLELDHYLNTKDSVYIFDSKYYNKIYSLDYKQVSYYYLTKNLEEHKKKHIYNALISPKDLEETDPSNYKIHFKLKKEYGDDTFLITEQYLKMIEVMERYIGR
ncbi:hypothetical protein BU051_12335 [Staphylococcus simulans]|uniref:LlaJI family restriction endonuclease n=1 Tax=Staphylococcus simulans TaxID=1286 RepID=UPI000D1D310F|nr:LlaJI family restriction endonuclease [Staphylococcus simulans]PTJ82206.1 hypothetical protein BU051_12335 [Staphylococcus simulans]